MVSSSTTSVQESRTISPNLVAAETKTIESFGGLERGFDTSTTLKSMTELSSGSTGSRSTRISTRSHSFAESIRLARTHSLKALDFASQLVDACNQGEFMEQFRLGACLDEQLALMWKHRKGRDEMWCKLLNFLQLALKSVDYDSFVVKQANAVRCVTEILSSSHVDRDDIRTAKKLLFDARLDHWYGISEPNSPPKDK
jgi:hypothetical protein